MSTIFTDRPFEQHGALLVRLVFGAVLLAHGVLKVIDFAATLAYFVALGLPSELAYLVVLLEIAGGLLLFVGYQTRWAALAVLPVLLGATWVHLGNGWLFSANGGGWEYPLLLAVLAVAQILGVGPAFSLLGGLRLSRQPRAESPA